MNSKATGTIKATSFLAVSGLVLAGAGLLLSLFLLGFLPAVTGVVLSHFGLSRIKRAEGALGGRRLAIAGLVCGYLGIVISLMVFGLVLTISIMQRRAVPAEIRQHAASAGKVDAETGLKLIEEACSSGDQKAAEVTAAVLARRFPENQRIALFFAVLRRSRFPGDRAASDMAHALRIDPSTKEGKCASYVLALDNMSHVDKNMTGLIELMNENPDDPLILWSVGIMARSIWRADERNFKYSAYGSNAYEKLLEIWDVGPVMVHQTYANVLASPLNLNEKALFHYRKAVEMEPKGWSYDALASNLNALRRYDEAIAAAETAAKMDPGDLTYRNRVIEILKNAERYSDALARLDGFTAQHAADQAWIWLEKGSCLHLSGRYQEAMDAYLKSIEIEPGKRALYDVGILYFAGLGVPRDVEKGIQYLEQSAEQGNMEAMMRLGEIYQNGENVPADFTVAYRWFNKAIKAGNPKALVNLGVMFSQGSKDFSKDYARALEYYEMAMKAGRGMGAVNAAYMYLSGIGVERNSEKAVEYLKLAVEMDNSGFHAHSKLATCYALGEGVPRDHVKSAKYQAMAAERGDPLNMVNLAMYYESGGSGFEKDLSKALYWYQKALDNGRKESVVKVIALMLAAPPEQKLWDADKALAYIARSEQEGRALPKALLAAVYARVGDFDRALNYQKEVMAEIESRNSNVPPGLVAHFNKLLNEAKQDLEAYARGECPDLSNR